MKAFWLLILLLLINTPLLLAQDCVGGAIRTHENYKYGRFEVAMQSAQGNGVVSSFFLYNVDLDCQWPQRNNEIDIEMTGNTEDLFFTTHHPGGAYHSDIYDPPFNPHNGIQHYAFEWEPTVVRWFVNGQLVNTQSQTFVYTLIHRMRILMNLWAADAPSWVGNWDPSVMPVQSKYDYVKYYEYTPGVGNYGTNNNYTFVWEDNFDYLNTDRWEVTQYGGFDGNYCTFKSSSVTFNNGFMHFTLKEDQNDLPTVPVTFSINTNTQTLNPWDVINLNGNFNNWCGACAPMTENNGIWSLTVNLQPGRYEYVFAKNFWTSKSSPLLGSACDFLPCDQYANYGVIVPDDDTTTIVLPTYCWNNCDNCYYSCIDTLNLSTTNGYIGSGIYGANEVVISNDLIKTFETSTMQANNRIRLNAGFKVEAGSRFKAYNAPCDSTLAQ